MPIPYNHDYGDVYTWYRSVYVIMYRYILFYNYDYLLLPMTEATIHPCLVAQHGNYNSTPRSVPKVDYSHPEIFQYWDVMRFNVIFESQEAPPLVLLFHESQGRQHGQVKGRLYTKISAQVEGRKMIEKNPSK